MLLLLLLLLLLFLGKFDPNPLVEQVGSSGLGLLRVQWGTEAISPNVSCYCVGASLFVHAFSHWTCLESYFFPGASWARLGD